MHVKISVILNAMSLRTLTAKLIDSMHSEQDYEIRSNLLNGDLEDVDEPNTTALTLAEQPSTMSCQSSDIRLFTESRLTRSSSHLLITKYAARHTLSNVAIQDLLTLIKLHCPSPNMCFKTLYEFQRHSEDSQKTVTYHYYCSNCTQEVSSALEECCSNCHVHLKDRGSLSSFLELNLESQFQGLFKRTFYLLNINKL